MKKKVDKIKRDEVKQILEAGEKIIPKEVPIIFDKKQYSLKLPKKFMDELEVNPKKDVVRIELILPPYHTGEKPKLKMELIKK